MVARPRTLDIVDPLYIPYGSLDVRDMEQNPPNPLRHNSPLEGRTRNLYQGGMKQTYPDLFARKLPSGLVARRLLK